MVFRCLLLAAWTLGIGAWAGVDLAQVQRAKAATVLVEAKLGESFGSGFLISDDGYVITNYHVIEDAPAQFRVVLHPGEPGQELARAQVVRKNKDMDLALLRLSGVKGQLSPIELGDTVALFETMPLIAFGYPFGKSLAVTEDAYPSASVNTGKITSLRRLADGTLREIQMDVLVNPGNSGGPVLDDKGKVVGVTVSGIPGSGVNFAIPVDQVRTFIAIPDLTVTPVREVDWRQRFAPVSVQVKAKSLLPPTGRMTCTVALVSGTTSRPMLVEEGVPGSEWTATAPLLEPPVPDGPVKVQIDVGDTAITTSIPSRSIGTDFALLPPTQRWDLRELAEIVPGKSLTCQAGFAIGEEGLKITGLAPVVVWVAGQDITIPVREIKSLRVLDKEQAVRSVTYEVVVSLDTRVLAKASGVISIRPSPWSMNRKAQPLASLEEVIAPVRPLPPPATAKSVTVPEPLPDQPAEAESEDACGVKLPARYDDCARAGNGRYLLLTMSSLKRVAVLDLDEKSIAGYVPLLDADALVAGGRQCLFVANRTSGLLERWTLNPLERDRRVTMPVAGRAISLTVGAGSDGPLLLFHSTGSGFARTFVDGQTLAPMDVEEERGNSYHPQYPPTVRAADCGTVFGAWVNGLSPSGLEVYVLTDGKLTTQREHTSVGHVLPGPNGEFVYTGTGGVYTVGLVKVPDCPADVRCVIPSSHPAYYLGLSMSGPHYMRGGDTRVSVFVRGLATPVLTLPPNKDIAATNITMARNGLSFEKRYNLVPQLKLLAILPSTNDSVRIQTVDIERSLREREIDFLFVESVPPNRARKGAVFRYQILARTSAKSLTYKLDSGPEGMTVSPAGEVVWAVPETADTVSGIIVSVTADDGQSLFHTFNLKLVP